MIKLLFLLLVLVPTAVLAQFNDSVHHFISASATGSFNRTSDGVTYLLTNQAKYSLRKKSLIMNASGAYLYGETPQKLTNNDVLTSLDFNLYKTLPHFYYWGLVNFTSSYSLKINAQLQSGIGIAYRFIDKENTMLSLSNGILFERSNITNEADSNFTYQTFRNSFRIQFRTKYKGLLTFNGTGFYQPSLNYANDYILTANASLGIKLWKWISLATTLTYNKISRTDRENFVITYGLVIERYL